MKKKILIAICFLVVAFVLYNVITYPPFSNSLEALSGIKADNITSMKIWHWGETKTILDNGQINNLLSAIDGNYRRDFLRNNFIFMHTGGVGGDWNITLVTPDKEVIIGLAQGKVLYKDYIYTCETDFTLDAIQTFWESN